MLEEYEYEYKNKLTKERKKILQEYLSDEELERIAHKEESDLHWLSELFLAREYYTIQYEWACDKDKLKYEKELLEIKEDIAEII